MGVVDERDAFEREREVREGRMKKGGKVAVTLAPQMERHSRSANK